MARVFTVICDGCPDTAEHSADGIIRVGLAGQWRELDVCETGEKNVRATIGTWLEKGRALTGKPGGQKVIARPASGPLVPTEKAKKIRLWAATSGIRVTPRGRIPAEIVTKYDAEMATQA